MPQWLSTRLDVELVLNHSFSFIYEIQIILTAGCTLSLPLKTSENRKIFGCFQGVEKGSIGNEWVKLST